jgi:hypothetical protein
MQREPIVTDEWRARALAARLKFAAVCKKQEAGLAAGRRKPQESPLLKAVERLIAARAVAESAKGPQ